MTPRLNMVRWYSLPRLAFIGVRVAVSTVFGQFADRRASLAAERPLDPINFDPELDYRQHAASDFWFDFVADTGDGWDSTYAVARLLGDASLALPNCPILPHGRVLVMGGDQVYPTPSYQDYRERLLGPFEQVRRNNPPVFEPEPRLYAVPGNHDWYDGLSAFLNLFCWRQLKGPWSEPRPGKPIGGWRTKQVRSYFALALPHDWWLWGLDIQLTDYVDQQQINFFDHVAREWMKPGSRLILCAGQPDWAYVDPHNPQDRFRPFSYVEAIADKAQKNHRLCLILTGDSHHYSRFTEEQRHYITAGGGGAFTHPTHQLKDRDFAWNYPPPGSPAPPPLSPGDDAPPRFRRTFRLARDAQSNEPRVYPPRRRSRWIAWRNLAFAFYNWDYALTLGLWCGLFAWMLNTNAEISNSTLPIVLREPGSYTAALIAYFRLALVTPWPTLLVAAIGGGYYYFADYKSGYRFVAGIVHTLAQTAAMVLVTVFCARHAPGGDSILALIAYVVLLGGFSAATVMGVYLLASLNVFGRHWNHAFSSLRLTRYKCFLRLCVGQDGGLTVYPIGLAKVPRDRSDPPGNPKLDAHLIEPPIRIT